jgi:hypothetical protein
MSIHITGYDWQCSNCPTGSFVTFTSFESADNNANEHANASHGGDTTGIEVVAVDHEDTWDEDSG